MGYFSLLQKHSKREHSGFSSPTVKLSIYKHNLPKIEKGKKTQKGTHTKHLLSNFE